MYHFSSEGTINKHKFGSIQLYSDKDFREIFRKKDGITFLSSWLIFLFIDTNDLKTKTKKKLQEYFLRNTTSISHAYNTLPFQRLRFVENCAANFIAFIQTEISCHKLYSFYTTDKTHFPFSPIPFASWPDSSGWHTLHQLLEVGEYWSHQFPIFHFAKRQNFQG